VNKFVAQIFGKVIAFIHLVFFICVIVALYNIWTNTNGFVDQLRIYFGYNMNAYSNENIKMILTLIVGGVVVSYALTFGLISMFIYMSETLDKMSLTLEKIENNTRKLFG